MPPSRRAWLLIVPVLLTAAAPLRAGDRLAQKIDALIEASAGPIVAPPATDAEFLRRAYLDFIGMIPTAEEARAFLDDPSPYKREQLIDRLLARPEYARRMQYVFDAMLMERRPEKNVPRADWQEFLRRSFADNVPYDQLVRRILSADGSEKDPLERAPARFLLDRDAEPYLLTRDIGRMFLGVDMQCAQCHDHPLIDDYKQAHFYGIFAFLSRSTPYTDPATNKVMLAEKADGDVKFTSVFKKSVTNTTGPRVLDEPPLAEPEIAKGAEYIVAPVEKLTVRTLPRHSRRAFLAEAVAGGKVTAFDLTAANRLWSILMKRGIVQPLDLRHSENPPSHPELLQLLATELREMRYDVKAFLKEVASTRVYHRSSEPPPGASEDVVEPSKYAVAGMKLLDAEQLAWSVMQSFGIVENYRSNAQHALTNVDIRLRDILDADPARRARRAYMIEDRIHTELRGLVDLFVSQYGSGEGLSPDSAGSNVHQALFLSNGEPIQSWLQPSGNNLPGRMMAAPTADAVAEDLYLSVLSRRPSADERREVAAYLDQRKDDKTAAVRELVWALLASSEFRFHH